jgi:hypothetical protein
MCTKGFLGKRANVPIEGAQVYPATGTIISFVAIPLHVAALSAILIVHPICISKLALQGISTYAALSSRSPLRWRIIGACTWSRDNVSNVSWIYICPMYAIDSDFIVLNTNWFLDVFISEGEALPSGSS